LKAIRRALRVGTENIRRQLPTDSRQLIIVSES
jgi:hypothetical protein